MEFVLMLRVDTRNGELLGDILPSAVIVPRIVRRVDWLDPGEAVEAGLSCPRGGAGATL